MASERRQQAERLRAEAARLDQLDRLDQLMEDRADLYLLLSKVERFDRKTSELRNRLHSRTPFSLLPLQQYKKAITETIGRNRTHIIDCCAKLDYDSEKLAELLGPDA